MLAQPLPQKLGRYVLLETLGSGGMCEVYRGLSVGAGKFHKQVAIKKILPEFSDDEQFAKMFEYEASLASRLTHSNIVEVYDFEKQDDTFVLAMEFVEGKNLRQFLTELKDRRMQCEPELALYIIGEVCKGLEYAHRLTDPHSGDPWNIVHRDISPENIMVSFEGNVKIVDFGIARAKDRVQLTRPNAMKGKLSYLSPEQILGQPADSRTDLFALSLVFYELLTLKKVFPGENMQAVLRKVEECQIVPPSSLRPEIGPELELLVSKGLAKDPAERYQSAGDYQREIQLFLGAYFPGFIQRDVAQKMEQLFPQQKLQSQARWKELYQQVVTDTGELKDVEAPSRLMAKARKEFTQELPLEMPVLRSVGDDLAALPPKPPPVAYVAKPPAEPTPVPAASPPVVKPPAMENRTTVIESVPRAKNTFFETSAPSEQMSKHYDEVVRLLDENDRGTLREPRLTVKEVLRYAAYAVGAGIVILFLIHRCSTIHQIVKEPETPPSSLFQR